MRSEQKIYKLIKESEHFRKWYIGRTGDTIFLDLYRGFETINKKVLSEWEKEISGTAPPSINEKVLSAYEMGNSGTAISDNSQFQNINTTQTQILKNTHIMKPILFKTDSYLKAIYNDLVNPRKSNTSKKEIINAGMSYLTRKSPAGQIIVRQPDIIIADKTKTPPKTTKSVGITASNLTAPIVQELINAFYKDQLINDQDVQSLNDMMPQMYGNVASILLSSLKGNSLNDVEQSCPNIILWFNEYFKNVLQEWDEAEKEWQAEEKQTAIENNVSNKSGNATKLLLILLKYNNINQETFNIWLPLAKKQSESLVLSALESFWVNDSFETIISKKPELSQFIKDNHIVRFEAMKSIYCENLRIKYLSANNRGKLL